MDVWLKKADEAWCVYTQWMKDLMDCRGSSPVAQPPPHHCWSSGHPPTFCTETKGRVTAAMTSCLLALARIFPLKNLSGKLINYTAKAVLVVHVGECGSRQWMEHFTDYQMFSLWNLESAARLFFHLETVSLTSIDLQPRIPWKQRGRARQGSVSQSGLYMDISGVSDWKVSLLVPMFLLYSSVSSVVFVFTTTK